MFSQLLARTLRAAASFTSRSPRFVPRHCASRQRRLFLEPLEDRRVLSTFTVLNTNDSGAGSLRQAIFDSFAIGPDVITFNIPASDPRHFYYQDDGVAGQVTATNVASTIATDDAPITDIDPDWRHSWWSIRPTSPLPAFGSVTIDGYSQGAGTPQAAVPNSNGADLELNAVLRIELDGSGHTSGLVLDQGGKAYGVGSTVRGLAIHSVSGFGISLNNGGHTIQGNFIGTDPSGTLPKGNLQVGIGFFAGGFNRIGTEGDGISDASERNLISGNRGGFGSALRMTSSSDNVIAGNFIGVDRTGSRELGNFNQAITISGLGADRNFIGTNGDGVSDDLERNIISGTLGAIANLPWGIQIRDAVQGNVVAGNFIGTDVTGTRAIGNALVGVVVTLNAFNTRVGTDGDGMNDEAERNVISGNLLGGVILGDSAHHNMVWGNYIGTQADGTSPLGNGQYGVSLGRGASNNQIGGLGAKANVIAFNGGNNRFGGPGVLIVHRTLNPGQSQATQDNPLAVGNTIRGNSIHSNQRLGIDLGGTFVRATFESISNNVTQNDFRDVDVNVNGFQNYPVLSLTHAGSSTRVIGTLNSIPNKVFTLDFYANSAVDPSGNAEGERYLGFGMVTTNSNGDGSFDITLPAASLSGEFITATATDSGGNTSEFSRIVSQPPLANAGGPYTVPEGSSITFAGVASDPDGTISLAQWDQSYNGVTFFPELTGTAPTFSAVFRDDSLFTIAFRATDNQGATTIATSTVEITNVAPSEIIFTDVALLGSETFATFTANVAFTDPGSRDTWTATVNYGDTTETVPLGAAQSFTLNHEYAQAGTYTVTVTITDDDGDSITQTANTVIVVGTAGDDSIMVEPGSLAGLKITAGGVATDNIEVDGDVLVESLDGDDTITLTASLAGGVVVDGGNGSDAYDITFGNLAGTVAVVDSGAAGSDTLTVNGTPQNDYIFKDGTQVTLGNPVQQTILYSGIESLRIHGRRGGDTIVDPGSDTFLFGDEGDDTIIIDVTSGTGVTANGGDGSDTYIIQDGNLQGPVTIADSGTDGTDLIRFIAAATNMGTEVQTVFVGASGQEATAFLAAGNEISFSPQTFTFDAPTTNADPVTLVLASGRAVSLTPGRTVNATVQNLAVNIEPESLNLESNGTMTVVVYGTADFNVAQINVNTVRLAGASAWQSSLVDVNRDGKLDLQLKFRRQDTILDQIYAQLLLDDHEADGILGSTRQSAHLELTGETADGLFSGADSVNLFLAGKSLRTLLDQLF